MIKFTQDKEKRLLELLEKEFGLFEQMLEQTMKQTELLALDDVFAFEKSLDTRQELIEKINGLHQESDVLMQSYISYSAAPPGKKSAAIDKATAKLRGILSECHEQNAKNIASIKERAEEHTQRIAELGKSKKTLGAYALSVPDNSEFFDKTT